MWLVNWLIERVYRVFNVFEWWWQYKIWPIFHTNFSKLWNVVVDWWGAAYQFFKNNLTKLENVVITWYGQARQAFDRRWTLLWQALSATWGFIWDHFFEGYKSIIDYVYSARVAIIDTYTRFKWAFAEFRDNPKQFIWDRLPRWATDLWTTLYELRLKIQDFFTNLYTTIADFLSRVWSWLYEHFAQWVKNALELVDRFKLRIGDFFSELYLQARDFLSRVWGFIWDHIPQEFKNIWSNAKTWWDWLKRRWDDFTREVGAFIDDPYGYLTAKLQAWIEGWSAYIFGVIGDLLDQLVREVILYVLDWMGFVAPPIEVLDEETDYFSPLTVWLEEGARAWRELKEAWVLEAMKMMEDLAAELRGEEEMVPKRPSQIFWENWWLLPDDVRDLINMPPIKG